jgi:subtilisin family serine protease
MSLNRLLPTIAAATAISSIAGGASAERRIGINIVLAGDITNEILADLESYGTVLDLLPQIDALTMRVEESQLAMIQALPYIAGASADGEVELGSTAHVQMDDLGDGANVWNLDAINVTDFGVGRTVEYDGSGVYVAVIDDGLPSNWREYFPEERIAAEFARSFGGGFGEQGTVSSQPNTWEHNTTGHGTNIVGVILGFRYLLEEPALPLIFNGVAPGATIIPIAAFNNTAGSWAAYSTLTRSILYVADLKASGALGDSPVVINTSWGGPQPDAMMEAAIDYAIANNVAFISIAHNHGPDGMQYPGAYSQVISAAASGWDEQFPAPDANTYEWVLADVPENDASVHFIAFFSGWELEGQDLDVAAPGSFVPVPITADGRVDYSYFVGTSAACPHVVGVVAMMLEKNPTLTQAEIESILESTAMPMPPDCHEIWFGFIAHGGRYPTLRNNFHNTFIDVITNCWENNANGAGLIDAAAALAATPPQ